MKRSTDRILTTHVGSLPRPGYLVELMFAKADGKEVDEQELAGPSESLWMKWCNTRRMRASTSSAMGK